MVHLKRWTRFSKLFGLERTDPLSFGAKFPEILVEWIALIIKEQHLKGLLAKISIPGQLIAQLCSDDSIRILLNLTRFLYGASEQSGASISKIIWPTMLVFGK